MNKTLFSYTNLKIFDYTLLNNMFCIILNNINYCLALLSCLPTEQIGFRGSIYLRILTKLEIFIDQVHMVNCPGKVEYNSKMLPRLFADWSEEQLDATVSDMEELADGGAALTAYGKLQYTDMPAEERLELKNSLLKYCELDTLAMVMIMEFFRQL